MKKTIYGIIFLIAAGIIAACSHSRTASPRPWPVVNPVVDSLSQKLDHAFFTGSDGDSLPGWIATLDNELAKRPNDDELAGRTAYYKAYFELHYGEQERYDSILTAAMESTDSASHPYLYNRVGLLADALNNERTVSAYDRTIARLKFFRQAGDNLLAGAQYTDLGNLLKGARDPEGAINAYTAADSLYRIAGYDEIATFNSLNLASALAVARDTVSADSILERLRNDPRIHAREDVYMLVLNKIVEFHQDSAALDQVWEMEGDAHSAMPLFFMANRLINQGDGEQALMCAEGAVQAASDGGEPDFEALAMFAASDACRLMGDIPAAYRWLRDACDLTDDIAAINEPEEISAIDTMRRIANRRLEAELAQSRHTLRWVCLASGLFILLLIAGWVISVRMQQLKNRQLKARQERDKVSRQLIATQIARDESEQLISSVGKEIDGMAANGPDTRKIINAIKSHAVRQSDRETFIESFTAVHPEFPQRLREVNEAFTDLDIRLASFIAMGMDTKHIAATMGVRPESVKQARWRLRTKLGLEKGASLENALRDLLN